MAAGGTRGAGKGELGCSWGCAHPHAKPWPGSLWEAHLQKSRWKTPLLHFCQQNLRQQLFAAGLMVPVSTYRQGVMMAGNISALGS